MMWDLGSGTGLQRHLDLLAEAERDRLVYSMKRQRGQVSARRAGNLRRRVGLALIRSGEEIAGICVDPTPRLS